MYKALERYRLAIARSQKPNVILDERGSLTILTLFFMVMILMIAGLGVDLMRSETDRARL